MSKRNTQAPFVVETSSPSAATECVELCNEPYKLSEFMTSADIAQLNLAKRLGYRVEFVLGDDGDDMRFYAVKP